MPRTVASYLITLQRPGAAPNPPASFMDDPNLKEEGKEVDQALRLRGLP